MLDRILATRILAIGKPVAVAGLVIALWPVAGPAYVGGLAAAGEMFGLRALEGSDGVIIRIAPGGGAAATGLQAGAFYASLAALLVLAAARPGLAIRARSVLAGAAGAVLLFAGHLACLAAVVLALSTGFEAGGPVTFLVAGLCLALPAGIWLLLSRPATDVIPATGAGRPHRASPSGLSWVPATILRSWRGGNDIKA